jgi:hypothetical protein
VLERLKRSEHTAGLAGSSGGFRALQIDAAASYPVWTAIGPWQRAQNVTLRSRFDTLPPFAAVSAAILCPGVLRLQPAVGVMIAG